MIEPTGIEKADTEQQMNDNNLTWQGGERDGEKIVGREKNEIGNL